MIGALGQFNVTGEVRAGRVGVWVERRVPGLSDQRDDAAALELQVSVEVAAGRRRAAREVAARDHARRAVLHLAILQMIMRTGKQIVVAHVIVVHVADDNGSYLRGIDADRFQSFVDRLDHFALTLLAHGRVEAGIEDDGAGASDNGPNVEVERLQHVMGIAADEVFR